MTDKENLEKVKSEIERRYNYHKDHADDYAGTEYFWKADEDRELLSFVDSLQEEPKKCMYSKDNYTAEDRKALCDGCEEECEFNKKEESINNGLDLGCGVIWRDKKSVSEQILSNVERTGKNWKEPISEAAEDYSKSTLVGSPYIKKNAFKAGANWQKKQMLANAVDATVHIDAGGYPYIPQMELYDYDKDIPLAKEGDKYKVILIKEE